MKPLLFLPLLWSVTMGAGALGRLIQPDGTTVTLGTETTGGSVTWLFPSNAVERASWLWLPSVEVRQVVIDSRQGRQVLNLPRVRVPGVRLAVEVPGGVKALTAHGASLSETMALVRSAPPKGKPWVTVRPNEVRLSLPPWKTAPGWTGLLEFQQTGQAPWQVTVQGSSTTRTFHLGAGTKTWSYAPQAWGLSPALIEARGGDLNLQQVRVKSIQAADPLPVDPTTFLAWNPTQWRESHREWFHWEGTTMLVLITADYGIQDRYLKRLAFYVEKTGYRGRLVTEAEIAGLHGWNAHDYAAADLARFFTQARQEQVRLNPSEEELLGKLVQQGIVVADSDGWKPGTGALLGVSAESAPALRAVLFVHESFHGRYFTSAEFRAGVRRIWNQLSEAARQAFRSYLAQFRYDPSDEGLMVNEFQAYVLQRPADQWKEFFRGRVIPVNAPDSDALLVEYLTAARDLDSLVRGLWGISSGEATTLRTFAGT